MTDSTRDLCETLSKLLLHCWLFGFVLLFIWLGAFLSGAVYRLHGPLIGMSNDELDVIHYCGMAFLKMLVLIFFFIPWLSIRLVMRKERTS